MNVPSNAFKKNLLESTQSGTTRIVSLLINLIFTTTIQ